MAKFDLNKPADFGKVTSQSGGRVLQQLQGLKDSEWDLQEASFNGVIFMVLVSKTEYEAAVSQVQDTGGRRKVIYSFPYLDGQTTDDLGRKGETFSIEAVFFGNKYMTGFKNLYKELNKPEPGLLVHPVRGNIDCVFQDFEILHQNTERKAMRVKLVFTEHNFTIGNIETITEDSSVKSALSSAVDAFSTIDTTIAKVQGSAIFVRSLKNSIVEFMESFKQDYTKVLSEMNKAFNPGGSIDIPGLLPLNEGGNVDADGNRTTDTYALATSPSEVFTGADSDALSPEAAAAVAGIEIEKKVNEIREDVNTLIADLSTGEGHLEFYQDILDLKGVTILLQEILERGLASSRAKIVNYTTPREMSIREVAFANGVDVDNVIDLEILNPTLESVNKIPKDTMIKVPLS